MNTSRKLAVLLSAAGLFTAASASAQITYNWNVAGDGTWTTPTNWNPNGVPGAGDTATIDDVVTTPHSQTVTYDISAGTLNTPIALGTLNLLNSAGATFTDVLNLTSTATQVATTGTGAANPQGVFTITSAITLGATAGTVELRLSPTATASAGQLTLQTAGITVNSGGLLTLNSAATTTTNAVIRANTTISGGTLSVLGSSSVSGFGSGTSQRNTLSMSSGNITFGNTNGRLAVFDNFTTTGGTITGSATNTIELSGAANSIAGVTYVNSSALTYSLRNNAAQSLTSSVDLPNLLIRNGQVDTVSVTSAGQNVGLITINALAGSTLQLGSNMNTATLPSLALAGATLDLNGKTLNVTATGIFTPTTGAIFNSSAAGGTFNVASFNFGTSTTAPDSVGANVNIVTTASPTGSANITSTAGTATFSPSSTLTFTGNSTSVANNRIILAATANATASNIGNLVVGNGTSTTFLQMGTGPLNLQGNMTVFNGSTFDVNSRAATVAGKLQGTGTIINVAQGTGGLLTFSSTGGLSPGLGGTTNTGSGFVGALTLGNTASALTLIGTSVSIFDLASSTSFDSLVAGGATVTVNGTLNVALLNGYTPTQGQTWNILTGLSATSTGAFSTISDGNASDVYSFAISGGIGVLTLNSAAVPEPSTWVMGVVMLVCAAAPVRRAFRKRGEA